MEISTWNSKQPVSFNKLDRDLSHEKRAPGWLGYIGDYTTQLYWDYNKPL